MANPLNPFGIPPLKLGSASARVRKPIKKGIREKVWTNYMGARFQGKCYCCRIEPITVQSFEVGHNKSVYSGGSNNINNLRPICRGCNREMGTRSIEWWKEKYYTKKKAKPKSKPKKRRQQTNAFGLPQVRMPKFY